MFKITVRPYALSRKGKEVAADLKSGKAFSEDVVFSKDGAFFQAYLTSVDKTNLLGQVASIENEDGSAAIAQALEDLVKLGCNAKITGVDEKEFNNKPTDFILVEAELKVKTDGAKPITTADTIKEEIDRIVSSGICDEETLKRKIETMDINRFPEAFLHKVLSWHTFVPCEPVFENKTKYVDIYDGTPILMRTLARIMAGQHQLLEGPKSTAKSTAAGTSFWLANIPYETIVGNKDTEASAYLGDPTTKVNEVSKFSPTEAMLFMELEDKFAAGEKLTPEEIDLLHQWRLAKELSRTVQIEVPETALIGAAKRGKGIIFDEINYCSANTLSTIINPLTDGHEEYQAPNVEKFKIHNLFRIIGTRNIGYTGTNNQNEATESRFSTISLDYPKTVKKALQAGVKKETLASLPDAYFEKADSWYCKQLIPGNKNGQWGEKVLNIRGIIRSLDLLGSFMDGAKPIFTLHDALVDDVIASCDEAEKAALMVSIDETINI